MTDNPTLIAIEGDWRKISVSHIPPKLERLTSYYVDGHRFAPAYLDGLWDGKKKFIKRNKMPFSLYRALRQELEDEDIKFYGKVYLPPVTFNAGITSDREYQNNCVTAMLKAYRLGGGTVLSATGSGKTAVTAQFFSKVQGACLFVVDELHLLHQTRQELEDWLKEPVGIIGESKFSPKRVTVGTIQTLSQSSHTSEYFDWSETIQTMVVDELHVMLGNRSFKVLEAIQPRAVYGLTASLQMTRKEVRLQVYAFSGPVLFNFPISEGQKLGVLAQGAYISVKFPETIPVTDQTAATIYSAEVVCNKKKTDVVHSFLKKAIGQDKYAVVLCERIKHVHNLSVSCSDIEHQLAYGEVKVEDRQDAQKDFEVGDIKLIIANKVFKKGVNIKRLDLIMDVAEMSNPNDVTQKFGRGVRLHKDKESLLYIDIGTKGSNNLGKAAKARKRAAKKLGVPCYELLIEPTDSVEDIVEDLWALSQKALGKLPVKATS